MGPGGWYLPKWEDINVWKKWHNNKITVENQQEATSFKKNYPTVEAFRAHCFQFLKTKMHWCHGNDGHCTECIRQRSWDT